MTTEGTSKYGFLRRILDTKCIYPVFQPIVSMKDGGILGYEALSRISDRTIDLSVEEMFQTADQMNKAWELEYLCRKESLHGAQRIDKDKKLFLNINPNIIKDEKFKEGFTRTYLERYKINPENIIFEVTERVSVSDSASFAETIAHYKNQHYNIAIDDMGSGYSGLNLLVDVKPAYLKMDKNLVRAIDKDQTKALLAQCLATFCKGAGIKLIAEGIETKEELGALIRLGFDYGQGYYLCYPQEEMCGIDPEKVSFIESCNRKVTNTETKRGHCLRIESVCKEGTVFAPNTRAVEVLDAINRNPHIIEFCIAENKKVLGFMTKADLISAFSGRFGYSLHAKKTIGELMKLDFLKVDCKTSIEDVTRQAMARATDQLYSPIIVEKDCEYLGIATVKDLLEASTRAEVERARHSNPLTGLPGNIMIEQEIETKLSSGKQFCIMYIDIDNFKAYNDAYGFENGDAMLLLVAEVLKNSASKGEFIGHVGGDDFVAIGNYTDGTSFCTTVLNCFSEKVTALYKKKDAKAGFIISKNRYGVKDQFPIATLSIAAISDRCQHIHDLYTFSNRIAMLKKQSKLKKGNSYIIK